MTAVSESDPSRAGHLRVDRIRSTPTGGGVWTRTPMPENREVSTFTALLETYVLVSGKMYTFLNYS